MTIHDSTWYTASHGIRNGRCGCVVACCALWLLTASVARAEKTPAADMAAADKPAGEAADQEQTEPEALRTVDLGTFQVSDLRPIRDVTAKLQFSLHLELRPQTSSATAAALEHWKHRLRDQSITAVRTAEIIDFADPQLARLQKIIRLRINRTLPTPLVERLLITGFTLSDML